MTTATVKTAIKNIAIAVNFAHDLSEKFTGEQIFYVEKGRRFDRIVVESALYGSNNRSVHAFVERATGDLIKAASWKAPQKNADGTFAVRYNLATEEGYKDALEASNWSGGYLYAR